MEIKKFTGKIKVLTGLHIGGGDDTMKIGGVDNGVIKDINSDYPYIPGSSLKGKMRSLLEWNYGFVGVSAGEPLSPKYLKNAIFNDKERLNKAIAFLKLFGCSIIDKDRDVLDEKGLKDDELFLGITRASFGDCKITEDIEKKYKNKEIKLTEAKYENVIDRQSGTAKHPRQTERVVAGVEFNFDIRIKVLPGDNFEEFKKIIEDGIKLLENDYLGGNGSRGYGRVEFVDKKWS